jgi:hypothetical protein
MTAPDILWVTRDFRLRDNPALPAAIADGPLFPLLFIDDALMAQGAASLWRPGPPSAITEGSSRALAALEKFNASK